MEEGKMFRGSVFYEMGMACDSLEERAELWQAIMEYGLYEKEPPQKFKRDFVNIRFILEKSKSLKQKRSEAGKSHTGNQYTKGDEKRKPTEQAQNNVVEQMEQAGTNGTNKNKNIEEEYKKENLIKEKKTYLENVKLTEEEHDKLYDTYDTKVVDEYMNRLNNYVGQHGDKYTSHYLAIITRIRKDRIPKKTKRVLNNDTGIGLIQLRK